MRSKDHERHIGPAVPRIPMDDDAIAENIVSAEPKLTIIKFYKNKRGQMFFRIAGMDPEAELKLLLEDLGTEDLNVINALLCDIRKSAMTPEGEMNLDIFHSILAKIRDEKPRTARAHQLVAQKAVMQHLFYTRVGHVTICETIDQDSANMSALKTLTKLSNELNDALNRECDQSPRQVLNLVNVGEGAPTIVNEVPRQQTIEHKPQPAFEGLDKHRKDDVPVPEVMSSSPASKQRPRYRPKVI
jgi:hypothetical protein